jgi:hypothetical protein
MDNCILKSDEIFNFFDFSISHKKLLLRATVINREKETFFNIDIIFMSTYFIQAITHFIGLEIYLGEADKTISITDGDEIFLKAKEYYILISEEKKYYLGARAIGISENNLDTNISSLKK